MGTRDYLIPNQLQLLTHLDSLTDPKEKDELTEHLLKFDFLRLAEAFKSAQIKKLPNPEHIKQPNPSRYIDKEKLTSEQMERLFNIGLKAVSEGKVAALVLAGGQASRLGSNRPKGILPLGTGLGSRTDSLLFLQASQIAYLQQMARQRFPNNSPQLPKITWLVMTSKTTDADTRAHLQEVLKETGLSWDQVLVFTQNEIPAFDMDGKVFLAGPTQLVTSPDGNGGLYDAIRPLLPSLEQRGVKYIHVYCVDNILCLVPDLHMIGCAIDMQADCATKVIEKKDPTESVGHVCQDEEGKIRILEYSEITKELAEKRDPGQSEKLYLRAGSIANHFFTLEFLREVCQWANSLDAMPYHVAHKRIPHLDLSTGQIVHPAEPNGIKLERFIFDSFCQSRNFLCWQVLTEKEFAPLKYPNSVGRDCLSTCLSSFNGLHGEWIRQACTALHVAKNNNAEIE